MGVTEKLVNRLNKTRYKMLAWCTKPRHCLQQLKDAILIGTTELCMAGGNGKFKIYIYCKVSGIDKELLNGIKEQLRNVPATPSLSQLIEGIQDTAVVV